MQQWRRLPPHVNLRLCQQGCRRADGFAHRRFLLLQRLFVIQLRRVRPLMGTALRERVVRIGTRGSQLALWQADWVSAALRRRHPDLRVEQVIIKTSGDKILDVPLAQVGGKGLFVKEIEEALLDGRIDLAVHSMKDMPGDIPAGLCIGPIPEREDPFDVLISKNGRPFDALPQGARIGTSSLRRAAQLRHFRPDFEIVAIRGNLDTSLKKLSSETERLDAIVLAAAGVKRLGLQERITEGFDAERMLPAVAQGALCIEMRSEDDAIAGLTAFLDHAPTRAAVLGERAFLHRLGGSCQVPVAGYGRMGGKGFTITGLVAGLNGRRVYRETLEGDALETERTGIRLAEVLLSRGADRVLAALTGGVPAPPQRGRGNDTG
jgi:hydroxymethylbilane synthase